MKGQVNRLGSREGGASKGEEKQDSIAATPTLSILGGWQM